MLRSDLQSGGETGGQRYSGESPLSDPGWEGFEDGDEAI